MTVKSNKVQAADIRNQYQEKKPTRLDDLKTLDAQVKRPAQSAGYACGSAGALIMGTGMSLIMTELGSKNKVLRTAGLVLGVMGMGMALTAAPLHDRILAKRRKEYAPQIIALSEQIENEEENENEDR